MIWLIMGAIVCVVIIVLICCNSWNDWGEKILLSILTVVVSLFMTLLVYALSSGIVSCCSEINYNMVSDTKIIALKDNQNIDGKFYVMGGYVSEDLYYYYATETKLGYKIEKIKANNSYIKYTDEETHIVRYKGEFANDSAYLWGYPLCNDIYIIYCPYGTVANEFSVDLE